MEPKRPWVLYVGPFSYPWGQAASRRVHGIAKSLTAAGYEVVVASADSGPSRTTPLPEDARISYFGADEFPRGGSRLHLASQLLFTGGRKAASHLPGWSSSPPAAIIVYGGSSPWILSFLGWCRRNRVALVADIVEWYDPKYVPGGRFGPIRVQHLLTHRFLHRYLDGLISISSFLQEHHRKLGRPSVLIPPTYDSPPAVSSFNESLCPRPEDEEDSRLIKVLYFGSPGAKDSLRVIIEAASNVPHLHLTIAGPTPAAVERLAPHQDLSNLTLLGKVPQEEVAELVRASDFTIIVREPKRSNQAGFPTKFVESMSLGTPVIANLTSDIGSYLKDEVNGLIVNGSDVASVREALVRASMYSIEEREVLRRNAHRTGQQFHYTNFSGAISSFIESATRAAESRMERGGRRGSL